MASEHNTAYTNMICRNVAHEIQIRNRFSKKDKYEVIEVLIARKWIKQPRVNVNLRYRITNLEKDELGWQITLQNIADAGDKFMLLKRLWIITLCIHIVPPVIQVKERV